MTRLNDDVFYELMPDSSGIVFFDSPSGETIFSSDSSTKDIDIVNNSIDWKKTENAAKSNAALENFLLQLENSGILIRT